MVNNVQLLTAASVAPSLQVVGSQPDQTGIYSFDKEQAVSFDARMLSGAAFTAADGGRSAVTSVQIEFGKTNYFFDQLSPENQQQAVAKIISYQGTNAQVTLSRAEFGPAGFYELRARALGAGGQPIGAYSDTITFCVP